VSTASYFTFYTGVIKDYRKSGPLQYAFDLTTLDEPLNGRIKTPTLSKWDFPNAEDKDRDIPIPLVLGEHDSTTVGGPVGGMIPCIRIGTTGGEITYLVSHGRVESITDVFVDGVSDGSAAANFVLVNGRRYQTINSFTSPPAVGAVVTTDCKGITDNGRGSGNGGVAIKNPAEQLKQIMAHWVFDEIQDTAGNMAIPAGTPIDETAFDAAANFFDIHSVEGSRRLTGEETGISILNEWCSNHSAVPYWNHEGKLSIAINDWFVDDIYDSAGTVPTFTHGDELGEFQYVFDTEILADEVSAEFLYSSADNKFFRTLRVIDTLRGIDRKEPRKLFWSRAKI
jgi:8-oxo-dGTP pyrophosphatase MutT (NUDIX family)